ncbi:hypothetical protein [Cohnella hongkongensis]|uniref:Uncharacterized protein n=1 Tax=Cohnella hongkongensis TaxID=178337 RepID=A0ABV9FA65_9BACL
MLQPDGPIPLAVPASAGARRNPSAGVDLLLSGAGRLKGMDAITLEKMREWPGQLDLTGYQVAFDRLFPHLTNSFLLVIPATALLVLLGSMNGYIGSKRQFRRGGANVLFALMLFGMFIPYQSILTPLIQFMQSIQLYNTIPGLILAGFQRFTPTQPEFRNS